MKRMSLFFLLIALLVLPAIAVAQDGEAVWDLSEVFTVTDLQLQFNYPKDWVSDTSNGIALAESQTDLAAQFDDDDATIPQGVTFNLNAVPFDAIELSVDSRLDEIVDKVASMTGITVDERFEIPLMTRRAIVLVAADPRGRDGAVAIWTQTSYVVAFAMGTPDRETTQSLSYSFGQLLSSFRPLDPLELGEPIQAPCLPDYSIAYPAEWTMVPDPVVTIYEVEADIERMAGTTEGTVEGVIVTLLYAPVADLQLGDDPTADDLMRAIIESSHLSEPFEVAELVLFDKPALQVFTSDANDLPASVTVAIVDGEACILLVTAPTVEQLDEFQPTWIAMLQSIQPVEA